MNETKTVVVVTSDHYWGKGRTLKEAFRFANVNLLAPHMMDQYDTEVVVHAYDCEPEKIFVSSVDGSVERPHDATHIFLGSFKVSELIPELDVMLAAEGVMTRKGCGMVACDTVEKLIEELEDS